jgi:hypothetical protein
MRHVIWRLEEFLCFGLKQAWASLFKETEELQSGCFHSVDEVIIEGVAWLRSASLG